jgi:hypothetical protein
LAAQTGDHRQVCPATLIPHADDADFQLVLPAKLPAGPMDLFHDFTAIHRFQAATPIPRDTSSRSPSTTDEIRTAFTWCGYSLLFHSLPARQGQNEPPPC